MKTFRVGLLGFGFMGKAHACGYLNLPLFYNPPDFGAVITHVCASRPETAAKAAAQVGAAHAVADFREITENPDIDVVDIATPNDRHLEALLSALGRHKHIYCDKPITATYTEALRVRQALSGYRGMGQMTLQNRFFPATMRAKQLIDSGVLGNILEFRGRYLHSGSADPLAPLKWKLTAAAGGGVVADLGIHILDLMRWLLGDFAELSAAARIAYPDRPAADHPARREPVDAEDSMLATVRLASGAIGQISASKIATGTEDDMSFEIHGSLGALQLRPMDWHRLYYYDARRPTEPFGGLRGWTAIDCGQRYDMPVGFPSPKVSIGWMRGHLHCLYTFLRSAADGVQYGPSLEDGIYLQYLLDKVKESARERKWVTL